MQMQLIYKGHKTLQSSPFFIITNEGKQDWKNPGLPQEKNALISQQANPSSADRGGW